MNQFDLSRYSEGARNERSRQRYRRSRKQDIEHTLTLCVGEPGGTGSGTRWSCLLGNHGNTVSVVLPIVAGEPVIVCDLGCDPRQLADALDLRNRLRQQEEQRARTQARRKATVHKPPAGNMMDGEGRSRLITETDGSDIPTESPRQLSPWDETMGGLE